MNRFKLLLFLLLVVFVSLKYTGFTREYIVGFNNFILSSFLDARNMIQNKINEHISQQKSIVRLEKENQELRKSALLSIAFAGKLNELLRENNITEYDPKVKLIQTISYANLNDYNKVWLDFEDFNKSRIYGLLYNGYSAGIVVEKDSHPLGLLLGDPKSIFSVYIGSSKIPGVVEGDKKDILVKYIPLWMNPKIGDEVITSGLDKIFFQGIRVGKVVKVIKEESSKTAVVKPYIKVEVPTYLHVIVKN